MLGSVVLYDALLLQHVYKEAIQLLSESVSLAGPAVDSTLADLKTKQDVKLLALSKPGEWSTLITCRINQISKNQLGRRLTHFPYVMATRYWIMEWEINQIAPI